MKPSRNDPFDLNLCMRGLGVVITNMHSDVYEYIYHFTFKKTMKSYGQDFKDPWEQHIEHEAFFREIDDPFVHNALNTMTRLIEYKVDLSLRFGIDEEEDLQNEIINLESIRFHPYRLLFKRSKSLKKLKLYYDRTISGFIESLSLYAYALTAQSNKIPLVLKRQLKLPEQDSLRLLNHDDSNIELIKELIIGLMKDLSHFRSLGPKPRKVPSTKQISVSKN
ncbi:hypothetical protein [Pedobacter foliorum]|uniref:hypothetical protein n=1 Tax=Pedobacter foliorum TaxID=2739058 RepID=UPI0015644442|nr:hypothetical protein [Pedobacter foliorum]NRF38336.1 hypothetical protein [Pedobacter foliorum]